MCRGCASPVRLATSQSSVAPWRGVSVDQSPRPFEVEPGTGVVVPSRFPFHLVLLIRLSTGVPAAVGEPGPPLGSDSSSTRISCRRTLGELRFKSTIDAARSAGWLGDAGSNVLSALLSWSEN